MDVDRFPTSTPLNTSERETQRSVQSIEIEISDRVAASENVNISVASESIIMGTHTVETMQSHEGNKETIDEEINVIDGINLNEVDKTINLTEQTEQSSMNEVAIQNEPEHEFQSEDIYEVNLPEHVLPIIVAEIPAEIPNEVLEVEEPPPLEASDENQVNGLALETVQADMEPYVNDVEEIPPPYSFQNVWRFARNDDLFQGTFPKGCKWCPDGDFILTADGNGRILVIHMPEYVHMPTFWHTLSTDDLPLDELPPVIIPPYGLVNDYCWYPKTDPSHMFFVGTNQGPVKLWKTVDTSSPLATYHAPINPDYTTQAYSLCTTRDGEYIYYGSKNWVIGHSVERPQLFVSLPTTGKEFGRGIISAIASSPTRDRGFAIGSYNRKIGIYDDWKLCATLTGLNCGVTYIKFSDDGTKLYAGSRGTGEVICWDMRNFAKDYWILRRNVQSQQRIYFDITPDDNFFVTGGSDGDVSIWNTHTIYGSIEHEVVATRSFNAGTDSVNGISAHPHYPLLVTASGQYHHKCDGYFHEDDNLGIPSLHQDICTDNGLKLFWVGNVDNLS